MAVLGISEKIVNFSRNSFEKDVYDKLLQCNRKLLS